MGGGGAIREGVATRELRLFLAACLATSLALWAFTVVLAIAAYREGGTGAVALAVLARVLPAAVATPFTALLADRRSRRGLLLVVAAVSCALLAALTLVAAADLGFAPMLALAAGYSAVISGQQPAQAALLTGLSRGPRQLAAANGLRNGLGYAAFFLGSVLGGLVTAEWSVEAGFGLTAGFCGAATLGLARMTPDVRPEYRAPRPGASVVGELLIGVREVFGAAELREAVGLLTVLAVLNGLLDVLIVVIAIDLVDLGAGGVGLLNGAWGAGGLVGGFGALALLPRGRFAAALAVAAVLVLAPLALLVAVTTPAVAIGGFVVFGVGYAFGDTAGQTLVQRLASEETLARAFGVAEASSQAGVALGSLIAPLLIDTLEVEGAIIVTSAILPIILLLRRRPIQRLDARAVVPQRELSLLRRLDLFAPLSLATVETLAAHATPMTMRAGEQIIRERESGDRFYVIAEGEVDVDEGGEWRRREGPGEYFGEIALLRDVPRTASVTAAGDGLLLTLNRDDFLGAVTGHRRSNSAVHHVIDFRLASPPEK